MTGTTGTTGTTGAWNVLALAILLLVGLVAPLAQTTTTGTVSGIVVGGADNRPVRLAIVTIASSGPGSSSRSTITDDDGRYAFESVPAGSYTLRASKAAHITNAFGARRPGRPGTAIVVSAGAALRDLRIELPRGAVITGIVTDQSGQPVPNASVSAIRSDLLASGASTTRPDEVTTDDRGVYRIFGLSPGEYLVAASVRVGGIGELGAMAAAEIDAALRDLQAGRGTSAPSASAAAAIAQQGYGFTSTYFPAAVDPAEARRIRVNAGDERLGTDIALQFVRTATLAGIVTGLDSGSVQSVRVVLETDRPTTLPMPLGVLPSGGIVDAAGRFQFVGVTPDRYRLIARTGMGRGTAPTPMLWAGTDVHVTGVDITGIALALRPGLQMTGKVLVDAVGETAWRIEDLRVTLRPEAIRSPAAIVDVPVSTSIPVTGIVSADGTFRVTGILPGRYVPTVTTAAPIKGWQLESAIVSGRDVLDHGLEIDSDDVSAVLTFTNRLTELAGSLQTPAGQPATEYYVIVFPSDRDLWRPRARRVQTTRPDTAGRFTFVGLPAGDYQIAALTDVEPDEWNDPNFLAALLPASIKLSLQAGERKTQDLRIGR